MRIHPRNKTQTLPLVWGAWLVVWIGIVSVCNPANGQEVCEEGSILEKIEPAESSAIDQPASAETTEDYFFAPKANLLPEYALDDDTESSNDEQSPGNEESQNSNLASTASVVQQPISNIGLSLRAPLPTPELKQLPGTTGNLGAIARTPTVKNYQWTAPNDYYRNLLFEEPMLERHGISKHPRLQPAISGLKFLKSGILFPLDVAKGAHKRCDNPLGWGIPGDHCR